MDIAKEEKLSRLTGSQKEADSAFIETAKAEFVNPLVNDMCELIPDFEDGRDNPKYRFLLLLGEAETCAQSGDSLTLSYGGTWTKVYAGHPLGKTIVRRLGERKISYYTPAFYDGQRAGSLVTCHVDDGVKHWDTSIREFLDNRRREYEILPMPFKVALIARYIGENVIAQDTAIMDFVLGCSENLVTHRWIAGYTVNENRIRNGWTIRLRDVEPTGDLGRLIASKLKNDAETVIAGEKPSDPIKTERRAGDPDLFTMVEYYAAKLDDAALLGKKKPTQEVIYREFMLDEAVPLSVRNRYENSGGNSFAESFRQYVRQHPEFKEHHPGIEAFARKRKEAK